MQQASLRVVVIGGGAAGFFGAITCAQAHPHTQVTLLEAGHQPLSKVRISGGGRCNVTHACFDPAGLVQNYPRGGKALRGAFSQFQAKDTVAWFKAHGVQLKTEPDGRMFPVTDSSETIVDCLINAAEAAGVKLRTGVQVVSVSRLPQLTPPNPPLLRGGENAPASALFPPHEQQGKGANAPASALFPPQEQGGKGEHAPASALFPPKEQQGKGEHAPASALFPPLDKGGLGGFEIQLKSGEIVQCDRLLLATGSNPHGYRWAKDLGHHIEPPVPSLFTFNVADARLEDLAGVSVESVGLRLQLAGKGQLEQTGPLLITHWGLSGPAVLKLSAWGARVLHECHYQAPLLINWLPQYNPEVVRQKLQEVKSEWSKKAIATTCPFPLPRRLWQRLVNGVGIGAEQRWAELSNKVLNQLVLELTQSKFQIQGKGVFKEEFVTCGGVSLKEVNFKTMESRLVPGLFFAGEILDIDGITGGFNFQSAWTTAWIAGHAMGNLEIKN